MDISAQVAQSIVSEMKTTIGHDINIMDTDGRIIASTDPARIGQLHRGAQQVLENHLSMLEICENEDDTNIHHGINLPIIFEGSIVGVIGITGDPAEVSVFGEIIKRMTEVMLSGILLRERQNLLEQARDSFLENWIFSEHSDEHELAVRGRLVGIDINRPYTVALLEIAPMGGEGDGDEAMRERIAHTMRRLFCNEKWRYCAVIRGHVILLLDESSHKKTEEAVRAICRELREKTGAAFYCGISFSDEEEHNIRSTYEQAYTAADSARSQGIDMLTYDETSLDFLKKTIPLRFRQRLRNRLFADCDGQEQEEMTRLICLYFKKNGDLQACADELYLHRNTVQYRIERMAQKTGCDLRHPRAASLLYLAIGED